MSAINNMLYSQKKVYLLFRWLFAGSVVLLAVLSILLSILPLFPPQVYQKYFIQEYLLAQAVKPERIHNIHRLILLYSF